jgi:hypothetical protein
MKERRSGRFRSRKVGGGRKWDRQPGARRMNRFTSRRRSTTWEETRKEGPNRYFQAGKRVIDRSRTRQHSHKPWGGPQRVLRREGLPPTDLLSNPGPCSSLASSLQLFLNRQRGNQWRTAPGNLPSLASPPSSREAASSHSSSTLNIGNFQTQSVF